MRYLSRKSHHSPNHIRRGGWHSARSVPVQFLQQFVRDVGQDKAISRSNPKRVARSGTVKQTKFPTTTRWDYGSLAMYMLRSLSILVRLALLSNLNIFRDRPSKGLLILIPCSIKGLSFIPKRMGSYPDSSETFSLSRPFHLSAQ